MVEDRNSARHNMLNLMMQHEEFIVIGLTGRIGSGCSRVAKVLSSSYKDLNLPLITPGYQGLADDMARDRRILQRYASAHWVKFDIIRARTAITSFLLSEGKMKSFLLYVSEGREEIDTIYCELHEKLLKEFQVAEKDAVKEDAAKEGTAKEDTVKKDTVSSSKAGFYENNILKDLETRYRDTSSRLTEEVSRHIGKLEDELSQFSTQAAYNYIRQCKNMQNLIQRLTYVNDCLDESSHKHCDEEHEAELNEYFEKYLIVHDILPALSNILRDYVKECGKSYTELFQKFGNYIRFFGDIPLDALEMNASQGTLNETEPQFKQQPADDIFAIPRKINQFIKALRHPFGKDACRPVRVVIDSIKNPFEAMYLRQRYSAFYLFAVSTNEQIRINRLLKERDKQMTLQKILIDGWAEYANAGMDIFLRGESSKLAAGSDEMAFYQAITSEKFGNAMYEDVVRKEAYRTNQQQYYLQDVPASIEAADIFINNNYANSTEAPNQELVWALVRNISLIMFPGLLLPTPLERCMQIAFSAKCNSGCLSRQVGAVVADKDYNILSVGWNDVPCGYISCARKILLIYVRRKTRKPTLIMN